MTLSSAVLLIFQDSVGIIYHLDKPGAFFQLKTAGNMVVSGALIQMVLSVSAWLVFQQKLWAFISYEQLYGCEEKRLDEENCWTKSRFQLRMHWQTSMKLARLHPSIHSSHGVNGRILMHRSHLPREWKRMCQSVVAVVECCNYTHCPFEALSPNPCWHCCKWDGPLFVLLAKCPFVCSLRSLWQ